MGGDVGVEPGIIRGPIVYILWGFIGAGTTTFAKQLAETTGAVRITKDEWLIRLIGNDPTIERYGDYDHTIIELTRDFAFHLAENGIDVILDEGLWAKDQRDEMRRRIEEAGAQAVVYFLDTPSRRCGSGLRDETGIPRRTRSRSAGNSRTAI